VSDLKPGDRALVVGCALDGLPYNGLVCSVISLLYWRGNAAKPPGASADTNLGLFYLRNLIRLPPDSECKRLFRETEKPREVPA
jgi:hypothetical protein